MKETKTDYVVLKCRRCRATNADWELDQFMRQLGKEYAANRVVSQFCGCQGGGNTEHVIVGIETHHSKPRTPTQVFALHTRRKRKSKRLVDILE